MIEDLILIVVGFIMLRLTFTAGPEIGMFLLTLSMGMNLLASIDILLAFYGKQFPSFKRFRKNKEGVVWIWAMAIATLIMASIVYFVASWPMDLVIQLITEDYGFAFTGVMGASFDLCRQIVAWLLGFCVFGVILWVLVNANKRGADYPAIG